MGPEWLCGKLCVSCLSRPQGQWRERLQPSANIRKRTLSYRTYHERWLRHNSGFRTVDPPAPRSQTVRDFGSEMRNTLVTPGKLSERVERWSEMCLRGFHESRRLPCPTTDFYTPLPPHPGSSSLPLTSVPTQQSPGAHTWPAENSSKLATELRTPEAQETMNLWVTLESSVQLSSEAGNQVATNGDKKSPHKDEESMACWPSHSLSFGLPHLPFPSFLFPDPVSAPGYQKVMPSEQLFTYKWKAAAKNQA